MFHTYHLVTVYNPDSHSIQWVTISAFCPECGTARGKPRLVPQRIGELDTWLHRWENPCGHQDDDDLIRAEIATQCAHPNCALMQSVTFYPYCGPHCAIRSAWDAVSEIRRNVKDFTEPLHTLGRLSVILESCPFEEGREMAESIDELTRAIAKAQRRLTARSTALIFRASEFFEQLDDLISSVADNPTERHIPWMAFRMHPKPIIK